MFYWAAFIKFSLSETHNIKSNKINYVSPIFLNCQQITAVRKDMPFQNKQTKKNKQYTNCFLSGIYRYCRKSNLPNDLFILT